MTVSVYKDGYLHNKNRYRCKIRTNADIRIDTDANKNRYRGFRGGRLDRNVMILYLKKYNLNFGSGVRFSPAMPINKV